jgi:hypothetical protein
MMQGKFAASAEPRIAAERIGVRLSTRNARYSSGSSGSAPWARCASSSACFASKASDNVLKEDQAEDGVLVLGRIHVVPQRIGGGPQLGLEAEAVCAVSTAGRNLLRVSRFSRHVHPKSFRRNLMNFAKESNPRCSGRR